MENQDRLKPLVPCRPDLSKYNAIFQSNYRFYCVVIGLSAKMSDSKKRAAKMEFDFNLSLDYLVELWFQQKGRCKLTDQILSFASGSREDKNPFGASIDRIDNSKGYVKGNVRLLSHWANNAKSTWDDECFEQFVKSSHQILVG